MLAYYHMYVCMCLLYMYVCITYYACNCIFTFMEFLLGNPPTPEFDYCISYTDGQPVLQVTSYVCMYILICIITTHIQITHYICHLVRLMVMTSELTVVKPFTYVGASITFDNVFIKITLWY